MNRLLLYYKRVLTQKYLYFLVGKEIGVSLSSRIFHNSDLLKLSFAKEVSRLLYTKEGTPRRKSDLSDSELDRLTELIDAHKIRSKCCVEYWVANKLKEVPEKYIRQFIADRYADCGLDIYKFFTSNRDLFFYYDKEENSYSSQVENILSSLISSKGSKSGLSSVYSDRKVP